MYRHVYSALIYPFYHSRFGTGAGAAIRELLSHDHLERGQVKAVEDKKLRSLLVHAHDTVPYYRRLFEECGLDATDASGIADFGKLPRLTKDLIKAHSAELHSNHLTGNRLDPNSTSGSTGSPMHFFTDRRSKRYRRATVVRNRRWIGIRVGDPVVRLWGSPIEQRMATSFRGRVHSAVTRETILSAYSASDSDFERYASYIQSFNPRLLIGYPSVLSQFARFCRDQGKRFPSLTAVIASAETLYDAHRVDIESGLGTEVYNRYGCREVGDIAHEVSGGRGLYVNSDRVFLEIVDDAGDPCRAGVLGQLLVTDLDNFGMPLIRYAIGDLGAWSSDAESILPFPALERVEGRSLLEG